MLQFFFNPLMLIGLTAVALPVIAHLLSRRKFDVVQWGAMQFLNPSRKTRRKMRLEELLLLLIRMLIIGLIALAVARPLINSGFLTGYNSAGSRDLVLVIDGSNSMGRSDGLTSLHQKAVRRATDFLETLRPGDTIAIIDARDLPVKVLDPPLQDRDTALEALQQIPPPAGAADLRRACEEAVGILGRSSRGAREIVVFTDRQRIGWTPGDDALWLRFDEVLKFPSVRPKVWVTDVSSGLAAIQQNISVGEVDVSRDLSVPGFPVGFQVPIRNSSGTDVVVPVQILINGQRLASLDSSLEVSAGSEATFYRSVRLTSEGTNLITVKVDLPSDSVKVDNSSHAAIQVKSAIPVLLVESSTSLKKSEWNTFFASIALTAAENKSPWIVARTVSASEVDAGDLQDVAAVVLPNVSSLPTAITAELARYVRDGKGLFISLGPDCDAESFAALWTDSGLLPGVEVHQHRSADPDAAIPTTIAPYSLEAGWLNRFRERRGASLTAATFQKWWMVKQTQSMPVNATAAGADVVHRNTDQPAASAALATIARLTSGAPLLLQSRHGRGTILLMTSTIDTRWNSLPAVPDYVPFLHEALFQMAASRIQRNVPFGQPLLTVVSQDKGEDGGDNLTFAGPFDTTIAANVSESDVELTATLPSTRLPGVYQLVDATDPDHIPIDQFVVNYDHAEDDPAELDDNDRNRLAANNRMTFVDSVKTLRQQMYGDESRSELWAILLWLFLALLSVEVLMTRRLVMQGHADTVVTESTGSVSN